MNVLKIFNASNVSLLPVASSENKQIRQLTDRYKLVLLFTLITVTMQAFPNEKIYR